MAETLSFKVTRTISSANDIVWRVLGDFGQEHLWSRALVHCERDTESVAVGTARTCVLTKPVMGRTQVRERVTEYLPGRRLAYSLDGAAGPFATASSRWSTAVVSHDRTAITVEGFFTPKGWLSRLLVWPLARPMIRRLAHKGLGELEAYLLAQQPVVRSSPSV